MEKELHVLIVEDSEDDTLLMVRELKRGGYRPAYRRVESAAELQQELEKQSWDLILSDYRIPRFSGFRALELVRERGHDLPFIIVSGAIGEETAVAAMKAGAHDYIMKGNLVRLVPAVEREVREAEERRRRRKAEERLRENEKLLRAIVDNSPAVVFLKDVEGRFLLVNRRIEQMFDRPREQLVGKTDHDLFPPETAAPLRSNDLKVLESRAPVATEETVLQKDGTHTYLSVKFPLLNEEEIPYAVGGISTDITDRKKTEEALRTSLREIAESREKIRAIFRSVSEGLIVTDSRNRLVMINRAAEELLGVTFKAVWNQPIGAVIEDSFLRSRLESALTQSTKEGQFDFELPGKGSGRPRFMRARTAAIRDNSGRASGVITILLDLTRERELDRMKTEFISTAAHELRTPLTGILGFAELLLTRDDLNGEARDKYVRHIFDQARALRRIVGDLLDISRIESGQPLPLNKDHFDLGALVRDLVDTFREQSALHRFEIDLGEVPSSLVADVHKIREVLENILQNAVRYSPEGGKIRISGEGWEGFYRVAVTDEGIGMSTEVAARVFDKFYRANASTTAAGGLGLGMSIVKQIVEAHEGRIWVESEPGRGTVVRFTLPVAPPEAMSREEARSAS
jgi:PAS domain S-box-containing protein